MWLGPLPRITPRVILEVEPGTPPDRIEKLKKGLSDAGYEVKSEPATGIPSHDTRVIYYKKSDAEEANSLVKVLPELGLVTSRETATQAQPRTDFRPKHYDLRVGKDSFATEPSP